MADQLTDDQIERLFAGLRAETVATVRPPGAGAARRTVRRRRGVSSVVAGVAALAVAGGLAAHGAARFDGDSPAGAGTELAAARRAVGEQFLHDAEISAAVDTVGADGVLPDAHLLPGTYTLRVACAGAGSVSVAVTGAELSEGVRTHPYGAAASSATNAVPCARFPWPLTVGVRVAGEGAPVRLAVEADGAAQGRAAVALAVTLDEVDVPALREQAVARLGPAPSPSSGLLFRTVTARVGALGAGRHRLRVSCAGTGTMAASVGGAAVGEPSSGHVPCGPGEAPVLVPFETTAPAAVTVTLEPSDEAVASAGYAYAVEAG